MLFETPIRTDRLELRPQSMAEFDALHAMHCDPEVMRWIGDGTPITWSREEALEHHRKVVRSQAERDHGSLSVFLRQTGQFIGWCGLAPREAPDEATLGCRYIKAAWGNGYATEAAAPVVAAGFERFGLDRIVGGPHSRNLASRRVLEKLGMAHVRDVPDEQAGILVSEYDIDRRTWESHVADHR